MLSAEWHKWVYEPTLRSFAKTVFVEDAGSCEIESTDNFL